MIYQDINSCPNEPFQTDGIHPTITLIVDLTGYAPENLRLEDPSYPISDPQNLLLGTRKHGSHLEKKIKAKLLSFDS